MLEELISTAADGRKRDLVDVQCGWLWLHRIADHEDAIGFCYFLGSLTNRIKIGFSLDPERRAQMLRYREGLPHKVLAVASGGRPREKAYHAQFAPWRIEGEWFRANDDLRAEIARLNSGRT
jgi:hypothetical protein